MSVEIAQALYDQNASVGLHNVHLPGGWHLNARRVSVPPVSCRGLARRDEIRRRQAILPSDLREDPAFAVDSEWRLRRTHRRRRPSDELYRKASSSSSATGWVSGRSWQPQRTPAAPARPQAAPPRHRHLLHRQLSSPSLGATPSRSHRLVRLPFR
jgi:hypothetical protein